MEEITTDLLEGLDEEGFNELLIENYHLPIGELRNIYVMYSLIQYETDESAITDCDMQDYMEQIL